MSESTKEIMERMNKLKMLLIGHPEGIAFKDIKAHMNKDRFMILRDLETIGAKPIEGQRGMYQYSPTDEDIDMAQTIVQATKTPFRKIVPLK